MLWVLGLVSILPSISNLAVQWSEDPIKSIGGVVVAAGFVLILMTWRSIGWAMEGSWWGLGILAFIIFIVHMRDLAVVEFIISPSWTMYLPPLHIDLLLYTIGVVLLFGGGRLLRAAAFPIALLWFSNPIPRTLQSHFEPLPQRVAVFAAHLFARAFGQRLPNDGSLLHFSSTFGLQLGPHASGISGAITLCLLALVTAWVYGVTWRRTAVLASFAVMLGLLLNLIRVFGMVVYCILALRQPVLQPHVSEANAALDIGLFFLGAVQIIRLLPSQSRFVLVRYGGTERALVPHGLWLRIAAFALLVILGGADYARAALQAPAAMVSNPDVGLFPTQIGAYTLQKVWPETVYNKDIVVYYWASYVKEGDGRSGAKPDTVWIAVSSALGAHDSVLCRNSAGISWSWHGDISGPTRSGVTHFSASTYRIANQQSLDAATLCTAEGCGMFSTQRQHLGFVYSRPDMRSFFTASESKPVAVLIRSFAPETSLDDEAARKQMIASIQGFIAGADIERLTHPYRAN